MSDRPRLRLLSRPTPGLPLVRAGDGLRSGFAALRHANFRYYLGGQIVSLVGTWMQSVSQPWLVLLLGGSPLQLGTVLALQYAPAMLLAPLGGVLADRVDKRRALMAANAVASVEAAILFVLTVTGVVQIWHVMLLAAALGMVNAVEMTVRQAFAAELVPREDLMNAIALNSASFNAARIVGPAVAGITLAFFGPAFNFGVNAVSYLAVIAGLWRIDPDRLQPIERPERHGSVRSSLAEGLRYARRSPSVLWPLVMLGGVAVFAMNFQTLLPLYARDTLQLGADGYGALFATMGAGSLVGSLALAFLGSRRPLWSLILGGGAFLVLFEIALGLTSSPLVAFPLMAVLGLSAMLMVNTINVTIQNSVTNEIRGRVMSLYVMVFAGSAPFGGFFAGSVAELWGPPAGFLIGGALAGGVVGIVAWRHWIAGARPAHVATPEALTARDGLAGRPRAAGE